MPSINEAQNAIEKINGKDLRGQKINVKKARNKRKPRSIKHRRGVFGNGGRADKSKRGYLGSRRGRRGY